MPLNTAAKILTLLGKLPPEVFQFVYDAVVSLGGSKSTEDAARRLKALSSKTLAEQLARKALEKTVR
jgi:tRNA U55 pseudouridine synthase TruB